MRHLDEFTICAESSNFTDIPVDEYDDYLDAYVAALRSGFRDIVLESGLIGLINETYVATLKAVGQPDD